VGVSISSSMSSADRSLIGAIIVASCVCRCVMERKGITIQEFMLRAIERGYANAEAYENRRANRNAPAPPNIDSNSNPGPNINVNPPTYFPPGAYPPRGTYAPLMTAPAGHPQSPPPSY
jgi:hypothetical protein